MRYFQFRFNFALLKKTEEKACDSINCHWIWFVIQSTSTLFSFSRHADVGHASAQRIVRLNWRAINKIAISSSTSTEHLNDWP